LGAKKLPQAGAPMQKEKPPETGRQIMLLGDGR
jgi:hypothetical protein